MDHRDRMQHLGRRAMQEPQELAIPPCTRTAECHKPVGVIHVKVERHGWGEGRLPIPAFVDIRTESDLDAECQRKQADSEVQRAKAVARAAAAAKMVREQKLQPHQQLDTIKARARAAKEFAAEIERRNAELLRKTVAAAASNGQVAAASSSQLQQQQLNGYCKLPLVQRHIPQAAAVPAAAAAAEEHTLRETSSSTAELAASPTQQPAIAGEGDRTSGGLAAPPASDEASKCSTGSLIQLVAATAAAAAEQGAGTQRSELAAQQTHTAATPASSSDPPAAEHSLQAQEQEQEQERVPCLAAEQSRSGQHHGSELPSAPAAAAAAAGAAAAAAVGALSDAAADATATSAVCGEPSAAVAATVAHSPVRVTSSCQARSRLLAYACTSADALDASAASPNGIGSQQCLTVQHSRHAAQRGAWQAAGTGAAHSAAGAGLMLSCVKGPASHCSAAAAVGAAAGSRPQPAVEAPHWCPVPPATQLSKPLLVKPMSTPPQAPAAQAWAAQEQQQQQVSSQQCIKLQLLTARPPWQGPTDSKRSGQQQDTSSKRTPGKASVQPAGSSGKEGSAVKPKGSCHQEWRLALPTLCSCGHKTPPTDPAYPTRCCVNCPLHNNPAAWQRLVVGLGLLDADD